MKKYDELTEKEKAQVLSRKEEELREVIPDVDWKVIREVALQQLSKSLFVEEDDPELVVLYEN